MFHSGVFANVQFGKDRVYLGYIVIARYSASLWLSGSLLAVELKKKQYSEMLRWRFGVYAV